jgi:hypothetical protein
MNKNIPQSCHSRTDCVTIFLNVVAKGGTVVLGHLVAERFNIEDLHVTSSMTSTMVAAMLEVIFSRRAGRFNGNSVKNGRK